MAYDEVLADRLRDLLPLADEKRMFGGIAFMEHGNLVVGVLGDELIARLGPDAGAAVGPGVRPFDFTGRPMKGWLMVEAGELDDEELEAWVTRCRRFVATLPAK